MHCTLPESIRCTRKGGSINETSTESSTRTMLEAEPCSTFRLSDIYGFFRLF